MKTAIFATALLCLGTTTAAAQAHGEQDAKSKVMALERLWGEAAQMRDIKALDTILDEKLLYIHIDGRLQKKPDVLADTKETDPVQIVVESTSASAFGNVVIVTGVLRLTSTDTGRVTIQHGRFMDTWLRRQGNWVCIGSMTTPVRESRSASGPPLR